MFYEFKSERMKNELYQISTQFLLGSNLLVSPVLLPNERKKRTYFPASRFYSFYTGEKVEEGEKFLSVDAPLNILPIFFREGFITPIQSNSQIKKLSELRKMPIDLVVALDSSYRASGNIMFDDGISKINLSRL
jgi:alpha-glucosidase (family GH31 glycosyl hydrolase)